MNCVFSSSSRLTLIGRLIRSNDLPCVVGMALCAGWVSVLCNSGRVDLDGVLCLLRSSNTANIGVILHGSIWDLNRVGISVISTRKPHFQVLIGTN